MAEATRGEQAPDAARPQGAQNGAALKRERDMTPEQILSIKPKVLTQKQREYYFENGYLLLEKFLPDSWIERLRATTDRWSIAAAASRSRTRCGTSTRATLPSSRACAGCPA